MWVFSKVNYVVQPQRPRDLLKGHPEDRINHSAGESS